MAYSKIVLTFENWDSGSPIGSTILFQVDGNPKNELVVLVRAAAGQVSWIAANHLMAQSFVNAWTADYAGTSFTVNRVSNVVTITATYDGAVFSGFSFSGPGPGTVGAVITNEAFDFPMELTGSSLSEADASKCTTVKVTLTEENGTGPFTWNTILPGHTGLDGDVPRSGGPIDIEIEDDNGEIDTIQVQVPALLDNSAVSVVVEGDPSGLHGTVTINMAALFMLTYTYSLDDVSYQSSNIFTSILPGSYTLYVKDNYGCTLSYPFEVTLDTIRPPAYSLMPRSNSFGWFQQQAAINDCSNPYHGLNAKPNDYKPTRFYNPKYFQPWCFVDSPITQFRSNYDTITAKLYSLLDLNTELASYTINKRSDNIGQRQVMDAVIYDLGSSRTGVYWLSGNLYDTDHSTVTGSYDLGGQLPEWVKVGQRFTLIGSVADGIYEIKQIIYDSDLLVNVAVIDREYTDVAEEVNVIVDAIYNKLNYETYEFQSAFSELDEGCYKIVLSMTDSLEEYPDNILETHPFMVTNANRDWVMMKSSDHIDDGILYSTGIVHLQRFQGLFYAEDYPSNYETSRDSRKALNKLDGRVQKSFELEVIDVPHWVHEKMALFISKKLIYVNNIKVQFEEPFEVERFPQYSRVNLKAQAFVADYEQYMTNTYDIL